ncbi:MAG: hemin uptake protein HemP [Dokdonella sp.]|uniref:hemin uptake protein HemP n=1 Tax=Dokdonella sp. TaxID=2291710 RepID=UPI003F80DD39
MLDSIAAQAPSTEPTVILPDRPAAPLRAARISSSVLLGRGRELVIEHAGQEYHLRLTRNDKLILTK